MTGVRGVSRGRDTSRPLLIAGLSFAVVATGVLIFTQDARWLRLGIIAGLWAALLGAFLATRYRKQAETTRESMAEAQAVYELELEREVAARREYELEVELAARRQADREDHAGIQDLRAEVVALRESLRQLMGGEVLYERVALTAQSTRMRSVRDEQPALPAGADSSSYDDRPRIVSGQQFRRHEEVAEQRTELISRVLTSGLPGAQSFARKEQRRRADLFQPAREYPEHDSWRGNGHSARWEDRREPRQEPAGISMFTDEPADEFVVDTPPPSGRPQRNGSSAEPHDPADSGVLAAVLDGDLGPGWQGGALEAADASQTRHEPESGFSAFTPQTPVAGGAHDNGSHRNGTHDDGFFGGYPAYDSGSSGGDELYSGNGSHGGNEPNRTLPEQALDIQRQGKPGGRRRKPDPEDAEDAVEPQQPPVGRHSRRQAQPPAPPPEPAGSHTQGTSVSDLLAAHGVSDNPRRRRRRD